MADLLNNTPDPAPRPAKKKKPSRKRRLSPALARVAQRSLEVTDNEVRTYQPSEMDLQLAEALLAGNIQQQEMAEFIGVSPATVSKHLRDPVAAAWIYDRTHHLIARRLGLVDAAVMHRAVAGDVRAADLLYKRYGQMIQRSQHVHHNVSHDFDPSTMSDDDLRAVIKSYGVVDADFTVKESADESVQEAPDSPADQG